jgi:hypothetical protein
MSTTAFGPKADTASASSKATGKSQESSMENGEQRRDHGDDEGEDEGGAPKEGDYSGLKENQKPVD